MMTPKVAIAFGIGVAVGAAALYGFHLFAERARVKAQERRITENVERSRRLTAPAFYHATRRVPIPPQIEFSTDSWRKLNFWRHFARSYSLIYTNTPLQPRRLAVGQAPLLHLEDPCWFEGRDSLAAGYFAHDALMKVQEGLSFDELVTWVSSNYTNWYDQDGFKDTLPIIDKKENP